MREDPKEIPLLSTATTTTKLWMLNSRIIEDSESSLLRIGTRKLDQEACMAQPSSFDVLCISLVLSACRRVDPPIWPDDLWHLFGRRQAVVVRVGISVESNTML